MLKRFKNAVRPPHTVVPLVLISLLTVGCGKDDAWHAETQPVQGKLSINGQSPLGAIVTLYPIGEEFDVRESKPWGVVDESGVYQLRTYEKGDGAPRGEYDVTFVWREDPSIPGSPDTLAGAYDEPSESEWTVTIEEGQTELPVIDVTRAKIVQSQKRKPQRPSPFADSDAQ